MKTIRFQGGLGNQMFQYAYGRYLELVNHEEVCFDTRTWYLNQKEHNRDFLLHQFHTCIRTATDLQYQQDEDGYYQWPKMYREILPELERELSLKYEYITFKYLNFLGAMAHCDNAIGVHVRRKDYGSPLPAGYYLDALSKVKGDILIFSDDPEWCRNVFCDINATFVDLQDYECFELLRVCDTKIIGNSTFSFWAAWLGGGKVICPDRWLGNGTIKAEDMPEDWIRIKDYR
jgi:hypothetical protein